MLKGIETAVYFVDDLEGAAQWYQEVLGLEPNHASEHYVGFTVAGYELGLHPMGDESRRAGAGEQIAYWSVEDADAAVAHFVEHGAEARHPVTDVGGGIQIASVTDPFGNEFGLIANPHSPNQ
jgi:predicted enzyme related to lactoylglutathione lyase